MNRLALAALLAFTACEGYVDPQLVEAPRTDGGIVAVQQAVTGQMTINFSEDIEISHNGTFENHLAQVAPGNDHVNYYLNTPHMGVVWEYYMNGPSWVQVPGVGESHATNGSTSWRMVGSGQRGCWEGIGCVALPTPQVDYTDYHHFAAWNNQWVPPGTDPNLPHPPVYLRRRYVIECPGGNYSRAVAYGTALRLDTAAASVNITVSGRTPTSGVFLATSTYRGVADDCGYGQEVFVTKRWCSLGGGTQVCYAWPN